MTKDFLYFLNEGKCGIPRVGWQLDSFGDSRENADLTAAMGMDALFVCKTDSVETMQRIHNKTAQVGGDFVQVLGEESDRLSPAVHVGVE